MYDSARRRRSVRKGRERGCWVYIPGEVLVASGVEDADPPLYRVFPGKRRSLTVTLYRGQHARG